MTVACTMHMEVTITASVTQSRM